MKKFCFRKSIVLLSFVFVAACATFGMPEWYVTPPQNDYQKLYGVGEGYSTETATNSALKNLSSRLMVTISAQTDMNRYEDNLSAYEEFRQEIEERVAQVTFNNYAIEQSKESGGKVYVLVAVDRMKFLSDKKADLRRLDKKINELNKISKNKSLLERRNSLVKINEIGYEGETLARIIGSVDNSFRYQPYIDKFDLYRLEYQKIISKMSFYFTVNKTPKIVIDTLKKGITDAEMKVVRTGREDKKIVFVDVNSSEVHKELYGSNMVKINLNVKLLDYTGKVVNSNNIELNGSSTVSKEQAINSAAVQLEEMIAEDGIIKVLGM